MKRDVRRYLTAGRTMYGDLVGTFVYEAMNELCLDIYQGRISAARPIIFSAQPGRNADKRAWALYLPGEPGQPGTITLHRGLAWYEGRGLVLDNERMVYDLLAHELAHAYQREYLKDTGRGSRGAHRRTSWYEAIEFASPRLLGFQVHRPERKTTHAAGRENTDTGRKTRAHGGRLTESEACHWPHSIRHKDYYGEGIAVFGDY